MKDETSKHCSYRYLNLLGDALLVLASDSSICFVNTALENLINNTETLGKGKLLATMLSPEDQKKLFELAQTNQQKDEPLLIKLDLKKPAQSLLFEYDPTLGLLPDGNYLFVVKQKGVFNDCARSDQDSLENSNAFYLIRTDLQGKYTYANQYFLKRFNFSFNQLIGKSAMDSIFAEDWQICMETVEKCLMSPMSSHAITLRKPDSHSGFFTSSWEFKALTDTQGTPVEIQCIGTDVTDQTETFKALQLNQDRLQAVFDHTGAGIAIVDEKGVIQFANEYFCNFLDYSPDELTGKTAEEVTHPEDIPNDVEKFTALINQEIKSYEIKKRYIKKDGTLVWGRLTLSAYDKSDNNSMLFIAMVNDIDEKVKQSEILEQNQIQFRKLLEELPDMVLIHQKGIIKYVNQAILNNLSLREKDLLGHHVLEFVHPEDKDLVANQINADKTAETSEDYEIRIKVGALPERVAIIRTTSAVFMGELATIAILIDITSRKEVEEALRESEEKFRMLAETIPFAIMIHQDDHFVYTNPAGERITGRSAGEIFQLRFWELVAPEYQELIRERGKKRQLGNEVPTNYEFQMQHKDGHQPWVLLSGALIKYKGKPAGLISVADITKRKEYEKQINEQAARMNAVLSALPDMLFICDQYGNFLEYFAQSTDLFALNPEKVIGSNIADLLEPQELKRHLKAYETCLTEKRNVTIKYQLSIKGQTHYFEARLSPIDDKRLLSIVRDITSNTRLNQELSYLSHLQYLMTRLSNKFINIETRKVDQAITEALKEIGEFTQVDRVYVFEYLWEKQIMTNTHEWCAEGITSEIDNLKSVPNDMIPDWVNAHKKGQTIDISRVDDLDPESNLYKILEPQGIKSLTTLPMIFEDKCLGYIGFDAVKQERIWTHEETTILKLFAELLTNLHVKAAVNKKLRSAEATNAFITDNIADAVILTDPNGNYSFISPSHKRITGRGEEVIGQSIYEHIHPDDLDLVKQTLRLGKKANKEYTVNYRYLHPQQGYIWIESTGKRYFDEGGQVFGLFTSRNIQERKTAEFELLKLSRAIEQSSASVIITNISGHIEYVNPAFCNNTGYSFDEVKGKNPRILKSGHTPAETYQILWHTIKSGGSWRGTFKTKRKDGSLFWEAASISPVIDKQGKITHFVAIKEDITEQRRIRNELVKAKEQAEESNRLKTAFINNIAHEIRTPLNGIVGFAELLTDQEISYEEKIEYLSVVNASSERLIKTVTDIMEVSLLVSGNKQITNVNFELLPLLDELKANFEPRCKEKNLSFTINLNTKCRLKTCRTDRKMVVKILSELISNAIKYTDKGFVKLICNHKKGYLNFIIADSGCGIPEKYQDKVFDYFSQADGSANRTYEGSGLGLSIAREMAMLLGGSINFQSELEKGSVIYLEIPCGDSNSENEHHYEKPKIEPSNHQKILIVEDDEINYIYLTKVLSPEQRDRIIWVTDGLEAVELCTQNKDISLVLMDIKIPGINGYEATHRIKQKRPDINVIALTAYAMEADQEKALQAGCDDFLSKPYSKDQLQQKLKKIILHEPS